MRTNFSECKKNVTFYLIFKKIFFVFVRKLPQRTAEQSIVDSYYFKGSLTGDFQLQVFFMNQCPPGPWVRIPLGPFQILSNICGDIPVRVCADSPNSTADYVGCFWFTFRYRLKCRKNVYILLHILYILVMAKLAKRKRTKASIMVFSSISKRSKHLR
jgi:hypothetical protein